MTKHMPRASTPFHVIIYLANSSNPVKPQTISLLHCSGVFVDVVQEQLVLRLPKHELVRHCLGGGVVVIRTLSFRVEADKELAEMLVVCLARALAAVPVIVV